MFLSNSTELTLIPSFPGVVNDIHSSVFLEYHFFRLELQQQYYYACTYFELSKSNENKSDKNEVGS